MIHQVIPGSSAVVDSELDVVDSGVEMSVVDSELDVVVSGVEMSALAASSPVAVDKSSLLESFVPSIDVSLVVVVS